MDKRNPLSVKYYTYKVEFQQVIWYTMIFGWLKAAETLRNPFGNPRQSAWNHRNEFCLDMYEELEVEIWKSTKFISNQDVDISEE